MKLLRSAFVALTLLALLIPATGFGDEMLVPLEKKVVAGTTLVNYAGQTLRFSTPVALLVKCDPISPTQFRLTVSLYPGTPSPHGVSGNAVDQLQIFWTNFNTDVYSGGIPSSEPWIGTLNTEGGFVDR